MVDTDYARPDMAELFQQFLAQLGTVAGSGKERKIPLVDKLVRQEDYPGWRSKTIRALARYDLDKYILEDVPKPTDEEALRQWRFDRADVDDYIRALVPDYEVWAELTGMGWKDAESDPKKTFDYLTQYFERGSPRSNYEMLREFVTIRREAFDKCESFQRRMNYLRQRLDTTTFKQSDQSYTWFALQGIAKEYPDLYNRSVVKIQDGNLTWSDLMVELRQLALDERTRPAMTTIKINNAKTDNKSTSTATTTSTSTTVEGKSKKWATCATCNKRTYKNHLVHCPTCGGHSPDGVCWRCEPEKAPDTWSNKEYWTKRKAERQTSTTGPLHQQSGVGNPNNTTDYDPTTWSTLKKADDGRKVIFQTSNLALNSIDLSAFQGGPQRI